MREEDALKAITVWPAQILGVAERIGTIEIGKDADLVIWDGNPLSLESNPEVVMINGKIVKPE